MTASSEVSMVGRPLPDFDLVLDSGTPVTSTDLRSKWTVVYVYPKDNTPGCTIEAHEFTELLPKFTKIGVAVYGLSQDSVKSHEKFVSDCSIGFPLISDPSHSLIEALGAWGERSMYGKTYMGALRNTYLVNPEGVIVHEWLEVTAKGHAQEVLDEVTSRISAD